MTHIERCNSLVRDHLAALSEVELKVWLVYHQAANDEAGGVAYPGTKRVAAMIGHRDHKATRRAIDALAVRGFLELVTPATFTEPARYRVTTPRSPTGGQLAPLRSAGPPLGRIDPPTGGQIAPPTGGLFAPPNSEGNSEGNSEEAQPPRRRRTTTGTKTPTSLPPELDGDAFAAAWAEWQAHRREIRKPLTPTSTRNQLAELAAMGRDRAIVAIRHTLARGWQGIREPDNTTTNRQPSKGFPYGPEAQRAAKRASECPPSGDLDIPVIEC